MAVRIMFLDVRESEHQALTEISWDEFFKEFELRKLALLYDEDSLFSQRGRMPTLLQWISDAEVG